MIKRSFIVVAFAVAPCVLLGCQSGASMAEGEENCIPAKGPNTVGAAAVNTNCPFTGEHADQAVLGAYQGKTIAFCCAGCLKRFNAAGDAEKAKLLATATTYGGK